MKLLGALLLEVLPEYKGRQADTARMSAVPWPKPESSLSIAIVALARIPMGDCICYSQQHACVAMRVAGLPWNHKLPLPTADA